MKMAGQSASINDMLTLSKTKATFDGTLGGGDAGRETPTVKLMREVREIGFSA